MPKLGDKEYPYTEEGKEQFKKDKASMGEQMEGIGITIEPVKMQAETQAEDMAQEEEVQVPDEQMESEFVDYVISESLSPDDMNYLEEALSADDRLSMIFDQVIETASEFSGTGPIEGPGSGKSDSIPARLSDGEYVLSAKAAQQIGPDTLDEVMAQAESDADAIGRRMVAEGGEQRIVQETQKEEAKLMAPIQQSTVEREHYKNMLLSNPRLQKGAVYG